MKNLAVFYGGKSAEHDISIITAVQVINNLNKSKYEIVPVYIDYNNGWSVVKDYKNLNIYSCNIKKKTELVNGFFDGWLLKKKGCGFKKFKHIDVAINCCHGLNGEDGTLAGLLTLANIPLVGSGVLASAVGMDKVIMKNVFFANNIPCVNFVHFLQEDYSEKSAEILLDAEIKLGYPMIVKPANLGSSIGINIAKNREELQENIQIALEFDKKIIIEQVVENLREINCSCVGYGNNVETSVLEEPKNWKTFLTFDEKYLQDSNENKKTIDVKLGHGLDEQIKDLSTKIFKALGCSGVVRIDYLLDTQTNKVYANEINTIPGSFANYLWKHSYTFGQLLDKLIDDSVCEYACNIKHNYAYRSNVLKNFKGTKSASKLKM